MRRVYVFGNEYLKEDALALKVADHLEGVEIVHCTTPDSLLEAKDEELVILDVVKGLDEPALIDPNQIQTDRMMSLHDFDLGQVIELGRAMGIIKRLRIIGVPQEGDPKELATKVTKWIS